MPADNLPFPAALWRARRAVAAAALGDNAWM
jgi:hypothetical protein